MLLNQYKIQTSSSLSSDWTWKSAQPGINAAKDLFSGPPSAAGGDSNVGLGEGLPTFEVEEESLLAAAANNFAVCSLHLRQLPIAIESLEKLIHSNPVRHLHDAVVFNLCTMYDLSAAPDVSTTKKRVLQRVANLYNIDDLHWRSFRLS